MLSSERHEGKKKIGPGRTNGSLDCLISMSAAQDTEQETTIARLIATRLSVFRISHRGTRQRKSGAAFTGTMRALLLYHHWSDTFAVNE